MLRHPCEYFIKYLLTLPRPEAQRDEWIRDGVKALRFPGPDDQYISELREHLNAQMPVNYDPADRYNRPSVKFLRDEGIWSHHHPDTAVREAALILVDPKPRKLIEKLLLGRMEPKEVARKTNSRLSSFYTTATIRAYHHYYWNIELLRTEDWVEFYDEYESMESARAISILQGGPSMALHMTGFEQHLESKEMLRTMQEGLFFDFLDWQKQPRSLERTRAMTSLAKSASAVDVRLSESDSALRESLKAFEQFRMKHAQEEVRGIDELAPAGTFTDSGAQMKELEAAKTDEKETADVD
jgi:hypothetical protein